jgi:hypothetical protein
MSVFRACFGHLLFDCSFLLLFSGFIFGFLGLFFSVFLLWFFAFFGLFFAPPTPPKRLSSKGFRRFLC